MQNTFGFNYIEEFRCLADRCEDNCCHGNWRIAIDDEQVGVYQKDYPDIFNLIAKDGGGYVMRREEGSCAGNDKGLCSVHRDHGESVLSNTCINYPRLYRSVGEHYTKGGTMSCPEIARKCLFDENPFDICLSELPQNHIHGNGIPSSNLHSVSSQHWRYLVENLINFILAPEFDVEDSLKLLGKIVPKMEQADTEEWVDSLQELTAQRRTEVADSMQENKVEVNVNKADSHASTLDQKAKLDDKHAEKVTLLFGVLLEHLDQANGSDAARQQVMQAFHIVPDTEPVRVTLDEAYKFYYRACKAIWIQPVLKRFVAAEISRCGFPFISDTAMGQDYGESITEWFHTLCIRTLAIRLYLVITAMQSSTQDQLVPSSESIVEWVYQYCRRINHELTGKLERVLRQLAVTDSLDTLWQFETM